MPLSPPLGKVPGISAKTVHFPLCGVLMKIQQSKRPGPPTASRRAPPSRAEGEWGAGKVPGFSAKTVHFPPRPAGALAPQASLAALGISTPRESAGFFRENGSLSPVAGRGTGSTGLSGGTWHFHLWGKCREFLRKRYTFPRGRQGHWLYRPLSPHLAFPPLGKVP